MRSGISFGCVIAWIFLATHIETRHVQLASERSSAQQSRPRLLVIRPPEGSGQPNRIVVLANPRVQPTNPAPPLSTAISALQETAAVAQAGLDRSFGGHPQSALRHRTSSNSMSSSSSSSSSGSVSSSSSSSSTSTSGTRSLRNLLQGMRNTALDPQSSNIARVSDFIPRAAPPMLPPAKRFGELNIPSVIEAALRQLQERARLQSNIEEPNISPAMSLSHGSAPHHGHSGHHHQDTQPHHPLQVHHDMHPGHQGSPAERPPLSGGIIDLSQISLHERNNRGDIVAGDGSRPSSSNTNPRWDIGSVIPLNSLGRNGITPSLGPWGGHTLTPGGPFLKNNDLLRMPTEEKVLPSHNAGRTGSNLRTFRDTTMNMHGGLTPDHSLPPLDLHTLLAGSTLSAKLLDQVAGNASGPLSSHVHSHELHNNHNNHGQSGGPSNFTPIVPGVSGAEQKSPPTPIHGSHHAHGAGILPENPKSHSTLPPANSLPKQPSLNINSTATVSASSAEANSTSNTTSTKSVKTKTIQVTTVVKGGTSADVAGAAATQAEIASAVAQGKDITSSDLSKLASAATGAAATTGDEQSSSTSSPKGQITVQRQPNGESIITLFDGEGEPVVLRATGPVKIERIVKPNGRIQFMISPISPPTAADPVTAADVEIEPEDITTTVATTANAKVTGFTTPEGGWTTNMPFSQEPTVEVSTKLPAGPTPADGGGGGGANIAKTIQITNTNVVESASSAVDVSVKNESSSASIFSEGVQQLFQFNRIPPPPKLSDINFGSAGLINPFLSDPVVDSNIPTVPSPPKISLYEGTTLEPSTKPRTVERFNLFPSASQQKHSTSVTDVMPQYNLLGVSPSIEFVPRANAVK